MPHRRTLSQADTNNEVNWFNTPGVWWWYLGALLVTWLGASALLGDAGYAWTYVHLIHGILSYYMLHYTKSSVYPEQQGDLNRPTVWEELDNETYGTRNRKLLTLLPLVLFVLATHGTDFRKQPLGLNLACVLVLLIAKLPAMHKVRILGINAY